MNLLDIIFPKRCLECGKVGQFICASCVAKVERGGKRDKNTSLWRYQGVIRKAIIAIKYKYATEVGKELAAFCVSNLLTNDYILPTAGTLVPIPLHWYRKNFRGFNQTELLGSEIAKRMNWQYEPNLLIRQKWAQHQVGLKGEERRKNLKDVFALSPSYILHSTPYILFDDVYTTGSTMKDASKVLVKAGVKQVWGLTVAR